MIRRRHFGSFCQADMDRAAEHCYYYREERSLRQEDLAKILHCDKSQISALECGRGSSWLVYYFRNNEIDSYIKTFRRNIL